MKLSICVIILFSVSLTVGQQLARAKCQEYAQNVSLCETAAVPLIVGGNKVNIKEFPHMVALGLGSTKTSALYWACGGSLISPKHVLTAAHCINTRLGTPQRVKLGTINVFIPSTNEQEVLVEKSLIHPNYSKPQIYNDVAVCFLQTSVKFNQYIRPACLNIEQNIPWEMATASGFGNLDIYEMNDEGSLLKVDLNIIPNDVCQKYFEINSQLPQGVIPDQLCAGDLKGGKDTCQGDSGGPLQVLLKEPYCMYSVIAVVSSGRFCGMENSPGVYTRVSNYISWIEQTVWGDHTV